MPLQAWQVRQEKMTEAQRRDMWNMSVSRLDDEAIEAAWNQLFNFLGDANLRRGTGAATAKLSSSAIRRTSTRHRPRPWNDPPPLLMLSPLPTKINELL